MLLLLLLLRVERGTMLLRLLLFPCVKCARRVCWAAVPSGHA